MMLSIFTYPVRVQSRILCSSYASVVVEQIRSTHSVAQSPAVPTVGQSSVERVKKINYAMRMYLEKAQKHEELIKAEIEDFELGKRHLANMMGVDAASMTQEDIDKAIAYLLPSSLYSISARPGMKHPDLLYTREKGTLFDKDGRPLNPFFYTGMSKFFQLMYEAAEVSEMLDRYEDEQVHERGISEPPNKLMLAGSDWISKKDLELKLSGRMRDHHYQQFLTVFTHLSTHPYAYVAKKYIMDFRNAVMNQANTVLSTSKLEHTESGRPFSKAEGLRKKSYAAVTLWANGSGSVKVDGVSLEDFRADQSRELVLAPFILLDRLGQFDVEAITHNRGGRIPREPPYCMPHKPAETARMGAVRFATCKALVPFVTKEEVEKMRLAGFLTYDVRVRERQKYSQKGARAKWIWKRR